MKNCFPDKGLRKRLKMAAGGIVDDTDPLERRQNDFAAQAQAIAKGGMAPARAALMMDIASGQANGLDTSALEQASRGTLSKAKATLLDTAWDGTVGRRDRASNQPSLTQAVAPVTTQTPAYSTQQTGYTTADLGASNVKNRLGLRAGGVVTDGTTPTADDVDVSLSKGEAVLPHKTVQALGGPEAVEDIIERTNGKPVHNGLRRGGEYADGSAGYMRTFDPSKDDPANVGKYSAQQGPAKLFTDFGNQAVTDARGLAGGFNYGVGKIMEPAAVATDAIKNAVSGAVGYQRPNPNGDVEAARGMANDGAEAFKAAFQPKADTIASAMGLKRAPQPAAATPAPSTIPAGVDQDTRLPEVRAADEARNNLELKGLNVAKQFMGGKGVPDGMTFRRADESQAPIAEWRGDNAAGVKGLRPENGTGVISVRQKDGSFKNTAVGQSEYTAADGSKTSDWSKTQAYADKIAQNAKDKETLRGMQRDRYTRDMQADITDPRVRQAAQVNLTRMDHEDAASAQAKHQAAELGLRQATLNENQRQFNETLKERKEIAQAAMGEKAIGNGESLLSKAGYEGDDAKRFIDSTYMNYPHFFKMPHLEQMRLMPEIKAAYEQNKQRNANSTDGLNTLANLKVVGTDKLNYKDDVAVDPDAWFDNRVWFGDDNDPKKMGLWNVFKRNNLPDPLVGSNKVDLLGDGSVDEKGNKRVLGRVMSRDNRGAAGPLGKTDVRMRRNEELEGRR